MDCCEAHKIKYSTQGSTSDHRFSKANWTAEEDAALCRAVQRFNGKNWKQIAACLENRTVLQCKGRWKSVIDPKLVKGPWSKEEDEIIIGMVEAYGTKKWSKIAQALPGRDGIQCRERWQNHLDPSINKEAWTKEEELTLIRYHDKFGNKWAELTKYLPGRTARGIKYHWSNSSVKKKVEHYLASGLLDRYTPAQAISVQSRSEESELIRESKITLNSLSECSQGPILVASSSQPDHDLMAINHINSMDENPTDTNHVNSMDKKSVDTNHVNSMDGQYEVDYLKKSYVEFFKANSTDLVENDSSRANEGSGYGAGLFFQPPRAYDDDMENLLMKLSRMMQGNRVETENFIETSPYTFPHRDGTHNASETDGRASDASETDGEETIASGKRQRYHDTANRSGST